MKKEIPKKIKRLLREQMGKAYEEEIRRALLPIAVAFEEWKAGGESSGELTDMIHEYHQGIFRDLYNRYNVLSPDLLVPHAIASGILDKRNVPSEILNHFAKIIETYEKEEQRG